MAFSYLGSGKIKIGGCTGYSVFQYVKFRFPEGSIVYVCQKAKKGILEAIAIKKVLLNGQFLIPIYVSTYNAVFNENELCTYFEAVNSLRLYYGNQISKIDKQINKICTKT